MGFDFHVISVSQIVFCLFCFHCLGSYMKLKKDVHVCVQFGFSDSEVRQVSGKNGEIKASFSCVHCMV